MKKKTVLRIQKTSNGFYADDGLDESRSVWWVKYFRDGDSMLHESTPTYYPTRTACIAAVEAAGFEVEGEKYPKETQTVPAARTEGIPVGTKLVRIGSVDTGEYNIDRDGKPELHTGTKTLSKDFVVIAPDNPYNVIDLATVLIPDGYERDGATPNEYYRVPLLCGYYVEQGISLPIENFNPIGTPRICIRKITPKTKKVLVVETDYTGENFSGIYDAIKHLYYNVAGRDARFRIEERSV